MSYRAGTYGLERFGIASGRPRIICDGCDLVTDVQRSSGLPFAWFMNGKAPPKWLLVRLGDALAKHYCPRCREDLKPHGELR